MPELLLFPPGQVDVWTWKNLVILKTYVNYNEEFKASDKLKAKGELGFSIEKSLEETFRAAYNGTGPNLNCIKREYTNFYLWKNTVPISSTIAYYPRKTLASSTQGLAFIQQVQMTRLRFGVVSFPLRDDKFYHDKLLSVPYYHLLPKG